MKGDHRASVEINVVLTEEMICGAARVQRENGEVHLLCKHIAPMRVNKFHGVIHERICIEMLGALAVEIEEWVRARVRSELTVTLLRL